MIGKIKKFDKKLFDKYDVPARDKIKSRLQNVVADNPDIYAEDMILNIPECKYKFLELQVCARWNEEKFPYDRPFVYARKKTFSNETLFIILNQNMTRGLLFDKKSITNNPRRLKKYSRYYVYEIPWHRILNFSIDDLDIETIKMYY